MNAQEIVEKFPGRDKGGYVVGFYLYSPRGGREGGPYPTYEEADSHRSAVFVQNIICGHVLTDQGTIVQGLSEVAALQAAVDEADRAALGDSNDGEISALRDALSEALWMLRKHADIEIERKDFEGVDA
ncbi:hypothetical protein BH772_gp046 [Gordonia phage Bachita]|uniref:Uncharacterized protein n=1 Tax=Gordonia phage Bachita TaxID=1838061 RepID=A0A160DFW0_9CAUD|nr:hypothetical protein BH772_gp046 [Gordonia phage Bachita]ANA86839.1 hypothetical protein PBI_BACHITA_165 [Gordonia phage Bachita]